MTKPDNKGPLINAALVSLTGLILGFIMTWMYGPLEEDVEDNEKRIRAIEQEVAVIKAKEHSH